MARRLSHSDIFSKVLFKGTLLRDSVKVKEQLENLAKTFEEIQDKESVRSIKNFKEGEVKSTKNGRGRRRKEGSRDVSIRPLQHNQFLAASNPFSDASTSIFLEAEIL